MPYDDQQHIRTLFSFYKIQGIPTFVVLDGQGRYITKDGKHYIDEMGVKAFDHFLKMKEEMYADMKSDDEWIKWQKEGRERECVAEFKLCYMYI